MSLELRVAVMFYPFIRSAKNVFCERYGAGRNPVSRRTKKHASSAYFPRRSSRRRPAGSGYPGNRRPGPAGPPPRTTIWVNVANSCRDASDATVVPIHVVLRLAWWIGFEAYTVASKSITHFSTMYVCYVKGYPEGDKARRNKANREARCEQILRIRVDAEDTASLPTKVVGG